jgi:hypothetical protein
VICLLAPGESKACIQLSAPSVISEPGEYCLSADLKVTDEAANGITVTADNVAIDMGDFAVIGPGALSRATGIYANGVKGLHLRGGRTSGFLFGVRIDTPSTDHAASDIVIKGMKLSDIGLRGIKISAQHALISLNRIERIGGSPALPSAYSHGIEFDGNDCTIDQNFIAGILPFREGEGVGISLGDARGCVIRDNLIRQPSVQYGRTAAIWIGGAKDENTVTNNYMIGGDYGVLGWWNDAKSNFIRNTCDPILHDAEYFASNDFSESGACLQTPAQLRGALKKDDSDPLLHFDLARTLNDLVTGSREAEFHFDRACQLGLEEACRRACQLGQETACRTREEMAKKTISNNHGD